MQQYTGEQQGEMHIVGTALQQCFFFAVYVDEVKVAWSIKGGTSTLLTVRTFVPGCAFFGEGTRDKNNKNDDC